ncbi:hypothetical protein DV096_06750 [Bradymonadaceae bacterium TMQ3]|uniref:Uncharacterized protein n=1 Tax=Lujinxingia sediminis TaxID=2480984 RepID=A0ABY0CR40_9DELT|nr:hypothetical protein [Lujinxingia sediminis]RDV38512.1 hypothetical protein DV096_06750 [Bradymonadaceae bacterium TMQ3]RVU42672.1 hypothetical protein EA187_15910 [Lujinxingia sediminis]TXC76720.1 hypothetical protein FRC91_08315 [Bradymonadales bacterium TMQ1]
MTRQALQPMVCDAPEISAQMRAQIIAEHELDQALTQAELDANEFWAMAQSEDVPADGEELVEESASTTAMTRRLQRDVVQEEEEESVEPGHDPLEPVDPFVAEAQAVFEKGSEREVFAAAHGVTPEASALAFVGPFVRYQNGAAAVYTPGESLKFYTNGQLHAQLDLSHTVAEDVNWEGISEHQPGALRVVRDGTLQVLIPYAVDRGEEGARDYYVGIYKVIGNFVGRIFERRVAHRPAADAEVQVFGAITFMRGESHRAIGWAPLGDDAGEPEVLRWNNWEGVFRVPGPAPTSPKPRS